MTIAACELLDKVNRLGFLSLSPSSPLSSTRTFHLHSPAAVLTLASIWASRSFDLRSTLVELMFSRWPYKTHIARGSVTVDTHGLRYVTLSCFGFTEQPDKTTFGNVNMLKLHGPRRARPGVSNTISFNPICCESSPGRKERISVSAHQICFVQVSVLQETFSAAKRQNRLWLIELWRVKLASKWVKALFSQRLFWLQKLPPVALLLNFCHCEVSKKENKPPWPSSLAQLLYCITNLNNLSHCFETSVENISLFQLSVNR